MEFLELYDKNKDNYVPKTRNEMMERIEQYRNFIRSFDKNFDENNEKYYELLCSLINLDISSFDISFEASTRIPNLFIEVLKYNAWHRTKNVVDKFGNKYVNFLKEENQKGLVTVSNTSISEIVFEPELSFIKPSINVICYESDFEIAKDKLIELREKSMRLKKELGDCRINQVISSFEGDSLYDIEPILERYYRLHEEVVETKKLINIYRKNMLMYKEPLYREVAYALLEEYHMLNEKGKSYTKSLPWITLTRKSL